MKIGRQRGAQGFECGDVAVGRVVQLDETVHTFERGLRGVDESGELDGVDRFDNERDRAVRTCAVQTCAVRTCAMRTCAVRTCAVRTCAVRTCAVRTRAVRKTQSFQSP